MEKYRISRWVLFEGANGGGEREVADEVGWRKVLRVCPHLKKIDVVARAESKGNCNGG